MTSNTTTRKEQGKRYHKNDIDPASSPSVLAVLASVGAVHLWNKNESRTDAESLKCHDCEVDHLLDELECADAPPSTSTLIVRSPELLQTRVTGTPSQHGHCSHCHQEETESINSDNDDEDPKDIPPYVDRMHASTLGGALDHRVALKDEAKYLLLSEDVYPVEHAKLTFAPNVPPPIKRRHPAKVVADIVCKNKKISVSPGTKFEFWPFGFHDEKTGKLKLDVPGPIIRARQGDVLQVNFTNHDETGMAHSVDFHAVHG